MNLRAFGVAADQILLAHDLTSLPQLDVPRAVPRDKTKHIRLMYDILALAFQTDATRVATFMLGNAGSDRSYAMVDVADGHHSLSHHRHDPEKIAKLQRID